MTELTTVKQRFGIIGTSPLLDDLPHSTQARLLRVLQTG